MRSVLALSLLMIVPAFLGCIGTDDVPLEESGIAEPNVTDRLPSAVHGPGGTAVELPEGAPVPAGLSLPLGDDAIEPTLGITSDGTIFYAAAQFTEDPVQNPVTDIYRSTDGGQTWENVRPTLPDGETYSPPQTGDPYVWVDEETDRVYSIDMFPALACSWLAYSDDKGESWTTRPLSCEGTPPVYDHQTLGGGNTSTLATTPAYDNILYQCINRVSDSLCARSLDGGLTWSSGTPVFAGYDPTHAEVNTTSPAGMLVGATEGLCGGLHGHVAVGPAGTVYLPREYCGTAAVGVSTDDGTTWTATTIADDHVRNGPDPAVTTDAAGNAYYLYVNATGALELSISTDQGSSWSEPIDVGHPNVTAAHLPTIDAVGEGKIAFAYAGTETLPDGYANSEFDDGYNATEDTAISNATWNGYITVVEDALVEDPVLQTTLVNDRDEPLVRGYCGPGRCPGMYDFIDIQIHPDGRPYAAFVDACVDVCDTPNGTWEDSQGDNMAFKALASTLTSGPSLTTGDALAPLSAVNATTSP